MVLTPEPDPDKNKPFQFRGSAVADESTIPAMVARRAAQLCEKVALQTWRKGAYDRLTYRELGKQTAALAGGLRAIGVRPGETVGILGENRPEWAIAYFASQACGGIAIPLDSLMKPPEIQAIARDSGTRWMIVSERFREIAQEMDGIDRVISMDGWGDVLEAGAPMSESPGVTPDDLAAIIYTSGTTGKPKGVMLSHRNILTDARGAQEIIRLGSGDIFLSVLPLHHTFECTGGLICPVDVGATVTYARSLKSRDLLDDMRNTNVTVMLGVPLLFEKLHAGILRGVNQKPAAVKAMFRAMMGIVKGLRIGLGLKVGGKAFRSLRQKAGLGSVRLFICGGAPLPISIPQGFEDLGFSFAQGYGLTETSPVLTVNPAERPRHDSVGVPVPGSQVRIRDPGPDGVGEILAAGDIVMKGYYKDPEMTARALKDGWFYTGDLGRIDRDGYLHICGRSKNVIVTPGGKNVYPEEIETLLNPSPLIKETLVYGVPTGDGGGEDIEVLVVSEKECFDQMEDERGTPYSSEEIETAVREEVRRLNSQMADYKRIRRISVLEEELPKTSTQKVRRHAIPELRKGRPSGSIVDQQSDSD